MPFKNREYRLVYRRKWYAKNKESEIAHVTKRKRQIKIWLQDYKANKRCSKCGETHPATLEFHHVGGKIKDRNISQMVVDGISVQRILEEMKKCKVVCSNCHKKMHYEEKINKF